eukprot:10929461-Alexandrium_andersonii.AAC.1
MSLRLRLHQNLPRRGSAWRSQAESKINIGCASPSLERARTRRRFKSAACSRTSAAVHAAAVSSPRMQKNIA